jgi:CSLREA domain-containing protein
MGRNKSTSPGRRFRASMRLSALGLSAAVTLGTAAAAAGIVQLATSTPAAAAGVYVVTTTADPDNGTGSCATGGACSLREAINQYDSDSGLGDVINVPAGTYALTLGSLMIDNPNHVSLVINGSGEYRTIIEGNDTASVVTMAAGETVVINNLEITGGRGPAGGGIDQEGGNLTLLNVLVEDNSADAGGGIFADGSLRLLTSTVTDNTTFGVNSGPVIAATENEPEDGIGNGGGIFFEGTATLIGSLVIDNSTVSGPDPTGTEDLGEGNGGGIYDDWGALNLTASFVADNTAGVANIGGTNEAPSIAGPVGIGIANGGNGGGIFNYYGTVNLSASTVVDNGALGSTCLLPGPNVKAGAGVTNESCDAPAGDTGDGGGIANYGGTVTGFTSSISSNTADGDGGGLWSGVGGVVTAPGAFVTLNLTVVQNNHADGEGGGIYAESTALTLRLSPVTGNSAGVGGGGILYEEGSTLVLTLSPVLRNTPDNVET